MSETVVTMKKNNKKSGGVTEFLTKYRKSILVCVVCILALALILSISVICAEKANQKKVDAIEEIEFTLTNGSRSLEESEIIKKQDEALSSLSPYLEKSGIAGVRANMLAAEIYYQKRDFTNARLSYVAAAEKGKKSYTAPINYYNAAVCSESLEDNEKALEYYDAAVSYSDRFLLRNHALFSLGRVAEGLENYAKANEAYTELSEGKVKDDWSSAAKSRLIALKIAGKIE